MLVFICLRLGWFGCFSTNPWNSWGSNPIFAFWHELLRHTGLPLYFLGFYGVSLLFQQIQAWLQHTKMWRNLVSVKLFQGGCKAILSSGCGFGLNDELSGICDWSESDFEFKDKGVLPSEVNTGKLHLCRETEILNYQFHPFLLL